jgi:SecD/SecF fusion protein
VAVDVTQARGGGGFHSSSVDRHKEFSMWEKTLPQRFILIGVVLLIAIWLITPPSEKLRGGLDIEGGVAMIFEIQEEPGENNPHLAEDMKRLLQKRVDPKGVFDLKWRALGRNRLEVQMPLPPEENKKLKADFIAAREALLATNIRRGELEAALMMTGEQRAARLAQLAAGSAEREGLLREAAVAYDQYTQANRAYEDAQAAGARQTGQASQPAGGPEEQPPAAETQPATQPATQPSLNDLRLARRDALETMEDTVDAVLRTNFDDRRFQEVLDMDPGSPRRKSSLKDLREQYPNLVGQIDSVLEKYAAWRARRAFLEGPADLQRLLRGAGVLEWRILAEPSPDNVTKYDHYREQLHERGPRPAEGDDLQWFPIENPMAFLDLDSPAELRDYDPRSARLWVVDKRDDQWYVLAKRGADNGLLAGRGTGPRWRLKRAYVTHQQGRPAVGFELDPVGGAMFAKLTGQNIDKQLCIFVDDVAYSSANIKSRISTSGVITGDFSREKINYLIQTLQAGSLPARLKDTPLSERVIGSSLGHANLHKAFVSGVAGVIAVALIMLVYYLVCGAIANAALLMNIILVLAAMAMLGARFTLPGIAGVILTVGMTVDANVLIFERMREEKERGSSLRMVIKNGYDKAFSTIIDANITTLLICVIIYYVGSEEIKGFGLTLGWGIVCSLFTALFVTRTVFTLLIKYGLIKDVKMLHLSGVPKVDWYAKRWVFWTISVALVVIGGALLVDRGWRNTLDVEFLGGVSVEVALKPEAAPNYDDVRITKLLTQVGDGISADGKRLAEATITAVPGDPTAFRVEVPGIPAPRLAAMITEPLEAANLLQRGGVDAASYPNAVILRGSGQATPEALQRAIRDLAGTGEYSVALAGGNIAHANVGMVTETGSPEERGRYWNITTTETNKALVQYAVVQAFDDNLEIQPRITYVFHGDGSEPYPITNRRLEATIPGLPKGAGGDVTDYLGGAALYFDQLSPPQTLQALRDRLRSMRLQPDYQDLPWRDFKVFGAKQAGVKREVVGGTETDVPLYSGIVIAVADPAIMYEEDHDLWLTELAEPELSLARATFDKEQTLRKVTQFKPQIAAQSTTRASVALVLSWAMIIAYLWIRFGRPTYGLAGVTALIHDVCIALAFVGISGWLGGTRHPIGNALLISDFKIDMTIVAAFLTIIGYSINDTIVVFDRIRETRGRLGVVSPKIINQSINQTLSRTLLTSVTTFVVLLVMYIFGGSSIRGFNYCMMIGVITGTYSSIAVASPLLLVRLRRAKDQPAMR